MPCIELIGDFVDETFVIPSQPGRVRWTEETSSLSRLGGIYLTRALLACFPQPCVAPGTLPDEPDGHRPAAAEGGLDERPVFYSQLFELDPASGLTVRLLQRHLLEGEPGWSISGQLSQVDLTSGPEARVLFVEQEEYAGRSRVNETWRLLEVVAHSPVAALVLKTNQPKAVLESARRLAQAPPTLMLTTLRALDGNTLHNHTWDAAVRHTVGQLRDVPEWMRVGVELWNEGCLWLHGNQGRLFWDMELPLGTQRLGGKGWTPGAMNVTCATLLASAGEPGWPGADHLRDSWVLSRQCAMGGNTGKGGEIVDLTQQLGELLRLDGDARPRADAFGSAAFKLPLEGDWSFARDFSVDDDLVRSVIAGGPTALRTRECPFLQVGRLFEIDEKIIEQLLTLNHLLRDYAARRVAVRPLSIAVFGPAGSGKSFTVAELIRSAALPLDPVFLSFNLSQLRALDDLEPALHAVQSAVLRGKLPVVFWDEFDAALNGQPLGWAKAFLAPMQDGEFFVRGASHPLGRSVFVFAGATAHTFAAFQARDDQASRDAKLADFASRIKAWLDVPPLPPATTAAGRLHRAMLVHSLMRRHAPHVSVIDDEVRKYLVSDRFQTARALEREIEAAVLSDTNRFTRARLLFTPAAEAAR